MGDKHNESDMHDKLDDAPLETLEEIVSYAKETFDEFNKTDFRDYSPSELFAAVLEIGRLQGRLEIRGEEYAGNPEYEQALIWTKAMGRRLLMHIQKREYVEDSEELDWDDEDYDDEDYDYEEYDES